MQNNERFFTRCPRTGKITGFTFHSTLSNLFLPLIGLAAVLWFLIRVLPKPGRAYYPCMKVAFPVAVTFVTWLGGFLSSVFAYKKARDWLKKSKIIPAALLFVFALSAGIFTVLPTNTDIQASYAHFNDPLGPNNPIGKAIGVCPGRVVWVYDADATNEDCHPSRYGDGYFLDKNCDQAVVDRMLNDAIKNLTDEPMLEKSWEFIFRYFNSTHGKGDVGYSDGEKIFIKVNSVHANSGDMTSDGSIRNTNNYGKVDTSPQVVLALLKHLVNKAGIPEENIYVGDPMRHMYKHCFDKYLDAFPGVNCITTGHQARLVHATSRSPKSIWYSDGGEVMDEAGSDKVYDQIHNAEYVINIPAMKGHRWGGVTFFAKNHFGSHTRSSAGHLHKGLMRTDYSNPLRLGYRKYRVFVDLMAAGHLGGKTLLYLMDGLWATSYEHDPPVKFQSAPFNNDWSSSIFVSQDPVAIESVCLDFMQTEFQQEDENANPPRYTYVQWDGVDDYLHQAADSSWWPKDVMYDPDGDGQVINSLGVHEHWNNPVEKQYSRNLGTGDGIELVSVTRKTGVNESILFCDNYTLEQNYPNPFNPATQIVYNLDRDAKVNLSIYTITGQIVKTLVHGFQHSGRHAALWQSSFADGSPAPSGVYFYQLTVDDGINKFHKTRRMTLLK